jgi:hypothetical protein
LDHNSGTEHNAGSNAGHEGQAVKTPNTVRMNPVCHSLLTGGVAQGFFWYAYIP